jgi:hypothetical protein
MDVFEDNHVIPDPVQAPPARSRNRRFKQKKTTGKTVFLPRGSRGDTGPMTALPTDPGNFFSQGGKDSSPGPPRTDSERISTSRFSRPEAEKTGRSTCST